MNDINTIDTSVNAEKTNNSLSSLVAKKEMLEENVRVLTDEVNEKRRKITETKKLIENTQNAIKAKQLEMISAKLGLSPEKVLEAVNSGNILIEADENVDKTAAENKCVTHDTAKTL